MPKLWEQWAKKQRLMKQMGLILLRFMVSQLAFKIKHHLCKVALIAVTTLWLYRVKDTTAATHRPG